MRIRVVALAITLALPLAAPQRGILNGNALGAQDPAPAGTQPIRTAVFLGRIISGTDSSPVRSADIRLFRIDSTHTIRARRGNDSLDIFVDTARSRVGITDSLGAFAMRRLEEGHYLMSIRRIGFAPLDGVLRVDSGIVNSTLIMPQTSQLLAKVIISEMSVDRVKQKLDRVGFVGRSHSGESGTFIDRAEILRRQSLTVADILSAYGIHDGEFILDRMPADYDLLRDYPADLVVGIEIYRHGVPTEFNMTRRGPNIMSPGGQSNLMRPTVIIWTFIR